ncbi:glycoprotein-N-acetylgalactosamine 3-beta-galactosyltransferase 1-like isoform X2 [Penaeus japonicus]|uniref:glycoprotein-N-acetylgalactosamine 3-beta-galactosyltransferase 1-like isoform X2 n=1 Tax=Penaeus japonicus TaxID=27405 RepID=UPI001C7176C3|nr:glycoprotein-N-acetylgalactosamine 3-beta-galactosyltransferase 1-like isoform X2 [Penaeus japonicus]
MTKTKIMTGKINTLFDLFLIILGSVIGCVLTFISSGHLQSTLKTLAKSETPVHSLRQQQHEVVTTEADRLAKEARILCWILTYPGAHDTKAVHLKNTWGKRCDKLIFMSTKENTSLGAVALNVSEGFYNLWGKTKEALKYVYNHHLEEYDWFLKADVDTYTIMENLRYMLSSYDPNFPIYFGSRLRKFFKEGFLGGGSGYVMSRETLRKFVEKALPNKSSCTDGERGLEDVELAKCLLQIGVLIGDSRDSSGRGRFFPLGAGTHILGEIPQWYKEIAFYKPHVGFNGCSDSAIGFHKISPELMYWYEFLLYHVRAYGIRHQQPFPAPLPPDRESIPEEILHRYDILRNLTQNVNIENVHIE